jgi:hypothetical protein
MAGTGGVAGAVQGTTDVGEAVDDGAGGLITRECGRTASNDRRWEPGVPAVVQAWEPHRKHHPAERYLNH